jgi:chromosome segregation ATPase
MSDKKIIDANTLEGQVNMLLEAYKKLQGENRQLKQDLAKQEKELAEANAKIVELNANYNRLKLAKMYGWDEKSKRQADAKIAQLVRDIDKCLGLLNEIDYSQNG